MNQRQTFKQYSKNVPELEIVVHYNGWHLELDGRIDSPKNLITDALLRAKVRAEGSDLCWPLKQKKYTVSVYYDREDGTKDSFETVMRLSERLEAVEYFLGKRINIGNVQDIMVTVKMIEIVDLSNSFLETYII